ncbi:MAG: putative membrane protein YdjX (TVP38/TMEM64 family) [Rhodothermales bacterium]|jgi:uncharacterized membrane protein YdjX (TVP38/TMEM64 family)
MGPRLKKVLAIVWVLGLSGVCFAWWRSGVALAEMPQILSDWLRDFGLGKAAVLYVFIYAIRPLTFFPAMLLTMASGLIFGPLLGIAFTIVGENMSANIAFLVARYFARDWVACREAGTLQKWSDRLRENGLMTVIILRLIYLPFDGVNYACGLTSMRQREFAIGTFIGIMPGLIAFVLLGSTASANTQARSTVFVLSLVFFVLGIVVAKRIRRQNPQAQKDLDAAA